MFVKTFLPTLVFVLNRLFHYATRWDEQLRENTTETQYDALVVIAGLVSDLIASLTGTSLFTLSKTKKVTPAAYRAALYDLRVSALTPADERLKSAVLAIRAAQVSRLKGE